MPALLDLASRRRYPIVDRLTIGRAANSDVVVDDALVSASHAEIVRQGLGFVVRDLGSRRGTFVGSRRIGEASLDDGTELLVGPRRLRFEQTVEGEPPAVDRDELHRLRAVVELGRVIGAEHDLDRLLERVLATCFDLLRADRGAIIVYPPGSRMPCATVARTRGGEPVASAISTSVLSRMMSTQAPYLGAEHDQAQELPRSASLSAQGVRSLIAVPLIHEASEREWLGVLQLDSQVSNKVFAARDLELLTAIAGQTALAIKNVMLVRRLQAQQAADERRLARVVEHLPFGVVVLDDERRCVLTNPWVAARQASLGAVVAGEVVDEVAGVPADRLLGVEHREQVTLGDPARTYTVAAHGADGPDTVVLLTDITEHRQRQGEVAHRERLALVGQLAGGIAHDFNNLLCVILNYADMLGEFAHNDEDREAAEIISGAARQAADMVRQILSFGRRDGARPRAVDVGRLLAGMEPLLRRSVGQPHVLAVSGPGELAKVLIDPSQLEQVVLNLVVNARDALPAAGRIDVKASLRGEPGAQQVILEVIDDGCGMSPDVIARVFEPYFTTKSENKGTGLGLATVYGIVEQAGGRIDIDSQIGRGTRFVVSLPATELSVEPTVKLRPCTARGRILVVDDDPAVRRLTERLLGRVGFDVVSASSGAEALEVARAGHRIDLLLTDLVMPGMSGRELADELTASMPGLRVLFMSAYHHGTPAPGAQFVAKPFDRAALLARLADAFEGPLPRDLASASA